MYSVSRKISFVICVLFYCNSVFSQREKINHSSFEAGLLVAGDEAIYYGAYGKYTMPLTQNKHYFTLGISFVSYFDFTGESEPLAYLKNDVDMRLLPSINFGYSLNFKKLQFHFEIPVGASIAVTKGTLVNERTGFERDYSNKEVFLSYGALFSPKYKINNSNSIGFYGFFPLVADKAQSGYQIGIGWTKTFGNKTSN